MIWEGFWTDRKKVIQLRWENVKKKTFLVDEKT